MDRLHRSILRVMVVLLVTVPFVVTGQGSASAAAPGPAMVYPANGQKLAYAESFYFRVDPVQGATGYLYGFFQNGVPVWENYANEGVLSSTEYAIPANTAAHNALQPGALQVWVRAYVNNNWTDATIIDLTLDPFYCITGPGGSCNGVGTVVKPSGITWNQYLTWLDDLASGIHEGSTLISCAAQGGPPDLTGACLKLLADHFGDNPALSGALGLLLCASGASGAAPAAIRGCVGTGALGVRAVIWAVREAAKNDANLRDFLETPLIVA